MSEDKTVYCGQCGVRESCKEAVNLNIGILLKNRDLANKDCLIKKVLEYFKKSEEDKP